MIGARKKRRIRLIVIGGVMFAASAALAGYFFNSAIVFFVDPTELVAKSEAGEMAPDRRLRLGGLVEDGTLAHGEGATIAFNVTDNQTTLPVRYTGALPDLFREGQGVVAEGYWRGGVFEAETILAKHDENYMPAEVAESIKDMGQWKAEN